MGAGAATSVSAGINNVSVEELTSCFQALPEAQQASLMSACQAIASEAPTPCTKPQEENADFEVTGLYKRHTCNTQCYCWNGPDEVARKVGVYTYDASLDFPSFTNGKMFINLTDDAGWQWTDSAGAASGQGPDIAVCKSASDFVRWVGYCLAGDEKEDFGGFEVVGKSGSMVMSFDDVDGRIGVYTASRVFNGEPLFEQQGKEEPYLVQYCTGVCGGDGGWQWTKALGATGEKGPSIQEAATAQDYIHYVQWSLSTDEKSGAQGFTVSGKQKHLHGHYTFDKEYNGAAAFARNDGEPMIIFMDGKHGWQHQGNYDMSGSQGPMLNEVPTAMAFLESKGCTVELDSAT